jgi:hypothetical protein
VTIPKPLVDYRIHGRNADAATAFDTSRYGRQAVDAVRRFEYAQRIAGRAGIAIADSARHLAFPQLRFRVASFRLARECHPVAGDTTLRIMIDALRAALTPQGVGAHAAAVTFVWAALVLMAPRRAAEALVHWRLSPGGRPPGLRRLLSAVGVTR